MMDFKREYLAQFVIDSRYEKAQMLWLWYDYHTETYDNSLFGTVASRHDPTSRMPITRESRQLSNKRALDCHKYMHYVARIYDISDEYMQKAKMDGFRNRVNTTHRIKQYIEYKEMGLLDFIKDVEE